MKSAYKKSTDAFVQSFTMDSFELQKLEIFDIIKLINDKLQFDLIFQELGLWYNLLFRLMLIVNIYYY